MLRTYKSIPRACVMQSLNSSAVPDSNTSLSLYLSVILLLTVYTVYYAVEVAVAEMGPVSKKIGRAKNLGGVLTEVRW